MQGSPELIDAARMDREEIAKAWLMRIVERTSLGDAGDLSTAWLASEAPRLIAEILARVRDPAGTARSELGESARDGFPDLARLRAGPAAAELIPGDLAALQSLMIEALRRQSPAASADDFAAVASRLAGVFGTIQAEVTRALVDRRATGAGYDELTGLPGRAQLDEWIHALLAEQRRYRHPFALALISIDGLDRVSDAYGREAADSLLATVAGVIGRQVRSSDRAFRVDDDELCVVAPHQEPEALVPMAERLTGLLASAQLPERPRLAITVGLAGCPRDADGTERLLDAAQEANYSAKAAGSEVASASAVVGAAMQDR